MKSEKKYRLVENKMEFGPFTESQIKNLIEAGDIFSETICIPDSLLAITGPLSKFFPTTVHRPVNAKNALAAKFGTTVIHTQTKLSFSKIEYLGMGLCALFLLAGTGESIFAAICLTCLFFGKKLYISARQNLSALEIVDTQKSIEPNCEKTKAPTTFKEITEKFSHASMELAKEMQRKRDEAKNFAEKKKQYIESIKNRSICNSVEVVVLGGSGWENKKDNTFILSMDASTIYMSDLKSLIDTAINIDDLREIEISGPGKVTSNAGLMGGGFGAEGALKGIAIATVVNILTTYSNTKTFIRLGFQNSEIVMLTSKLEPDKARILLSQLFLKVNRKPTEEKTLGVSDEIYKLHELKQNGAITDLEFEKLKNKLIS